MRGDIGAHMSSVKSRILGATEERRVVAQEAEAKEQRLSKAEATLNDRLDRLLCKRYVCVSIYLSIHTYIHTFKYVSYGKFSIP